MRGWNVGIVGGGPGGLLTAYLLQNIADSSVRLTLFEASNRLGGKILTRRFQSLPATYEAGAAELYDYSPVDHDPLRELIASLGLSTRPMGGSAVIMDGHILSNLDDVRDQFGAQASSDLATFDRAAKDWMNPREFYAADHLEACHATAADSRFDAVLNTIGEPPTRRFVENLIHSDLATEPEKTSVSYGLQNYLMNDPAYMKLYGIEGGIERLTVELARRIDATVLLEQRVIAIGRGSAGRLQVTSTPRSPAPESAATQSHDFDFVVVALPNNYLPDIHFHGPRLAEAMQRHHAHYDYPAHYLRISILFDRPFWRNKLSDSYFMLDAFGGCCLYDESAREAGAAHGVLGWLLGGQAALQMSDLNDEELIEQALNSLPEFLSQGRQFFLEGRVHRWVGAVNGLPGGVPQQALDQRHQPEPVGHPDLLVVGDYLFDSTLNGVLDSAEYVAHWLAALMANDQGNKA